MTLRIIEVDRGRPITQILIEARQSNSSVTLDDNLGNDLEKIIDSHGNPLS